MTRRREARPHVEKPNGDTPGAELDAATPDADRDTLSLNDLAFDLSSPDDAAWDVFLADDDELDPQPEWGDFWVRDD